VVKEVHPKKKAKTKGTEVTTVDSTSITKNVITTTEISTKRQQKR
jgi:hypothetical protein